MEKFEVPDRWVDAAMTGASPGCRDDARFYLANAYDEILWDLLSQDPQVVCACGMAWDVLVAQGPDWGHGRYECPSAGPATVQMGGITYELQRWLLTPLTGLRDTKATWQLSGWWRDFDKERAFYGRTVVDSAVLPGREQLSAPAHPVGKQVHVEMTGYGDGNGLFVKIRWDREE